MNSDQFQLRADTRRPGRTNAIESIDIAVEGDATRRKFFHRGTPADKGVIEQIFINQDYSLQRLQRGAELIDLYHATVNNGQTPLIFDAGANIGASVVHWSVVFPRAHVTAWEPDEDNFNFLKMNSAGLNVDLRCAAIGSASGTVALVDPGIGEWGYRTVVGGQGNTVPVEPLNSVTAEKIAARFTPFIAKIDIEGGEAELFSRDTGWVDEFPLLIVELHDWLLPRSANSGNFLRCIAERNRDFVYVGENVFSIRN